MACLDNLWDVCASAESTAFGRARAHTIMNNRNILCFLANIFFFLRLCVKSN